MSYEKAMKHALNIKKCRKQENMFFGFDSSRPGVKSIWANEKECLCGYIRPSVFFDNEQCDICRKDPN